MEIIFEHKNRNGNNIDKNVKYINLLTFNKLYVIIFLDRYRYILHYI